MDSVVHFEIPADDTARVQKFYGDVFGWNIVKAPIPKMAVADMGLYARIKDTKGNTIGLWQDIKQTG